jgi:hypothetical protein
MPADTANDRVSQNRQQLFRTLLVPFEQRGLLESRSLFQSAEVTQTLQVLDNNATQRYLMLSIPSIPANDRIPPSLISSDQR